jgi:threonine/homoserine/homoserine lactone efflux protein
MITLDFLVTSLIVVLIPGTGVVLTVSAGLTRGNSAVVFTALGCTLGIVPHLFAVILGLSAVMHAGAVAFQTLKFAGAIYLGYLAWATWRDKTAFTVEKIPAETGAGRLIFRAFLLNILNPKLTIFFLAFLPHFVRPETTSPTTQLLILSGIFMAMTFGVFLLYGFLANFFRKAVIESSRAQAWLRRGFAAAFAGLGLNLALSRD